MSLDNSWADQLLDAARRRNIVFSESEEEAILSAHPRSPLAQWVQRNLGTCDTVVLSNEELALWRHLQDTKSGLSTKDASVEWESIPTTDDEFRAVTADLNASTRAIERRSTILEAQNALASRLAGSDDGCRAHKSKHRRFFDQKEVAELQHVKFANEQLYETLRADLEAEYASVSRDVKSVPATVAEILNANDRALDDLNNVSANRAKPDADVGALRERAAKLTTALQYFRARAIMDRLDRTYLESLANTEEEGASEDASAEEVQNVHADLGSLYAEIDDVATMLVSHEYGNGVESTIQDILRLRSEDSHARTELAHEKLVALSASLDSLSSRLENLQTRRLALHRLHLQSQDLAPAINGPTRRRDIVPILVSNSTPAALSSRRADGTEEPPYPAVSALQRHFGLFSDMKKTRIGGNGIASTNSTTTNLHKQIRNLAAKLSRQSAANVQEILQISEAAFTTRRAASQSLSDALDTKSGTDLERALRVLENQVAEARAQIEMTTQPQKRPR